MYMKGGARNGPPPRRMVKICRKRCVPSHDEGECSDADSVSEPSCVSIPTPPGHVRTLGKRAGSASAPPAPSPEVPA
eukprot:7657905-Pyramimonas_sp.AAC.1